MVGSPGELIKEGAGFPLSTLERLDKEIVYIAADGASDGPLKRSVVGKSNGVPLPVALRRTRHLVWPSPLMIQDHTRARCSSLTT